MLLRSVTPFLEDAGFVVLTATTTDLALEALEANQLDAIVCDLRLEGMQGLEFLHVVRNSPRWENLPFVLITGAIEQDQFLQGRRLGVLGILTKPFDPEHLVTVLQEAGQDASKL